MFSARFVVLALVFAGTGCGYGVGANVFRLDTAVRPQTQPDSVLLLAEEPKQPYHVIALVNAYDSGRRGIIPLPGRRPARTNLLAAAARLGGDAVLLNTTSLTQAGANTETSSMFLQISGKVIVFDREATRSN